MASTSRRPLCLPVSPESYLLGKQEEGQVSSTPHKSSWLLARGAGKFQSHQLPPEQGTTPGCQSSFCRVLPTGPFPGQGISHASSNFQELISPFQRYILEAQCILANIYCLQHYLRWCFLSLVKIAPDSRVSHSRLPWFKGRAVQFVHISVFVVFSFIM